MSEKTQTILGGIFGILSIIAIIYQMSLSGYDKNSVAGAVQGIAGTMLNVMVLFLIFKNFYNKKTNNFEDRLKNKLEQWKEENKTVIEKSKNDLDEKTKTYGFDMFTDMNNFYKGSNYSKNSGWFVRLPEIKEENYNRKDIKIDFHLNKGTFFEGMGLKDEELEPRYEKIASNIINYIRTIHGSEISGTFYKNQTITIIMSNPIQKDEEIDSLIKVLDSMVKAYLVSANIKL